MPIMLSKTYAAFKAAGVGDSEAQAAAEELAGYENRLVSIDSRLMTIDTRLTVHDGKLILIENRLAAVEGRLAAVELLVARMIGRMGVLTWAVGINAAATIAIFGVLLHR
jgi:hypothetical protein